MKEWNQAEIRREVEEHLDSMRSQLDTIYNEPVTEGGMEYLMEHQDEITFCEDEIEEDLDILDFLEDDDMVLKEFFGKENAIVRNFFGKNNHDV